jgi:hypothetical protein
VRRFISAQPKRIACRKFDMTIGRMIPAIAIRGSMNSDSPEIMISGMAKPTAPFTKPATSVTPRAATKAQSGINTRLSVKHERPFPRCDIVIASTLQRKNA